VDPSREEQDVDDMHDAAVAEVMRALGAGEIDPATAAERVRPAYRFALAERATRDPALRGYDEAAGDPDAFTGVALARQTGVITMAQYVAVGEALRRG